MSQTATRPDRAAAFARQHCAVNRNLQEQMVLEDFCLRMGEILTALLIFKLKAVWKNKNPFHTLSDFGFLL